MQIEEGKIRQGLEGLKLVWRSLLEAMYIYSPA